MTVVVADYYWDYFPHYIESYDQYVSVDLDL